MDQKSTSTYCSAKTTPLHALVGVHGAWAPRIIAGPRLFIMPLRAYAAPMHPEALAFLKEQPVCVLAVEMPDGSPHAATVHFSHTDDPFALYCLTDKRYRKFEPLATTKQTRASVVIGFNESDMRTLQLDGRIRLLESETDIGPMKERHFAIHPRAQRFERDPNTVYLEFTPTWWRFTDWTKPEGKTVFLSDGSVTVVS